MEKTTNNNNKIIIEEEEGVDGLKLVSGEFNGNIFRLIFQTKSEILIRVSVEKYQIHLISQS
jgi:hypothetical protein